MLLSLILSVLLSKPQGVGPNPQPFDLGASTWAATDELGRKLPDFGECGPAKAGKFVGIFYFLWHERRPQDLYDNSTLLNDDPNHPAYGPKLNFHYWGKPWLGYYISSDPFVIRRHAQMLVEAGVDTLILDTTNGFTYDSTVDTLCKEYETMRAEGQPTPKICFFFIGKAAKASQHVYENFYAKGLYKDLWFYWKGKPLMLAPSKEVSPDIKNFFTIRDGGSYDLPNWFGNGQDRWLWVDKYPQRPSWHDDPKRPEELSVSIASHAVYNIGRSYHAGVEPQADRQNPAVGLNFSEQWQQAFSVNPEFLFITGWNEWIAFKLEVGGLGGNWTTFLGKNLKEGEPYFVDEYSPEFSRDAEPMSGGFGDDYYYQLLAGIRRYKGIASLPKPSAPKTISILNDFRKWGDVTPVYKDFTGDTGHRFFPGVSNLTYSNNSGRNDFETMKVARDDKNIYFYAHTAAPITAPAGPTWMTILMDADRDHKTGWEGYDYAINRTVGWLEKNVGGWKWEKVCPVKYVVSGNEMQVAVPRSALLMFGKLNFEFKWIDDVPEWGNIMDFIDKGDVAPDGRFNYVFKE